MKKAILTGFLLILIAKTANAQSIPIMTAKVNGENVLITYDLVGWVDGEIYEVEVYSSLDDYTKPLENVDGDIGVQRPGYEKLITWEAKKSIGFFTGDITFEIRASLIYSPIRIIGPTNIIRSTGKMQKFKAKDDMKISWTGGGKNESIILNLVQGDSTSGYKQVTEISKVVNEPNQTNVYNWTIPKKVTKEDGSKVKLETGKNYAIQFEGTSEYASIVQSPDYYIKKKSGAAFPMVLLAAALGGGAYYYFVVLSEDTVEQPPVIDEPNQDLPAPPTPN